MDFLDNAATRAVKAVEARLAKLSADEIASCERAATLDHAGWFYLGDLWSRSVLAGFIDTATATTLHQFHTRFNSKATLAERLVVIKCAEELLSAHIERGQHEVARREASL